MNGGHFGVAGLLASRERATTRPGLKLPIVRLNVSTRLPSDF